MNILFVDDCPERLKEFKKNAIDHLITYAASFDAAISALATLDYDRIYLDHDLSEEDYETDNVRRTGTELAQIIASEPGRYHSVDIVVHSLNKAGRDRMCAIFKDAGIFAYDAPWAWMKPVR